MFSLAGSESDWDPLTTRDHGGENLVRARSESRRFGNDARAGDCSRAHSV